MFNLLRTIVLSALVALAGCGGGGSSPSPIPEAHAAEPVSACPVGDATAQAQAIIDTAKGKADFPACVFNITTLRVSKPIQINCSGANVDGTVFRFSGDEGMVVDPSVVINIPTGGWNKRGFWFDMTNCRIEPAVKGGGKHPFVMRVRPGFFISSSYVARNHFGGAGEQGVYLDNMAGNKDGIFTTTFEKNFIENGVLGVNVGDSVHFIDNVVPNGANRSGDQGLPGFDLSFVGGAAESALVRNNITTTGGCIIIRKGTGVGLEHNWCEGAGPASVPGAIQLINCTECTARDNRVQTAGGDTPFAIVIDGGSTNALDSNKLNAGTAGHIAFVRGANSNWMAGNRFDGGLTGKIAGAAGGLITTP